MALSPWQAPRPVIQLTARSTTLGGGAAEHQDHEPHSAYYVDLASDEDEGAVIEARIDDMLGDLELLFQEQLAALAEDATEQNAVRKGKVVITDHEPVDSHLQHDHSSIMGRVSSFITH